MNWVFHLLFAQTWFLFILVTCANAAIWWRRSGSAREADPSLEAGYRSLMRGFLFWGNLPWIAMGVSILLGLVPSMVSYLQPGPANPAVLLWYALVVALWILGTYWLFLRGGAETLVKYPGLMNLPTTSPRLVKIYWVICLAGGVAGLTTLILPLFRGR